jgi:GNAT superfamily N-acetyltransferase
VEASRRAGAADLDRIVEMARAMRAELGAMRGGRVLLEREAWSEPLAGAYGTVMGRDDCLVVVGTIDDAVLGFGVAVVDRLHNDELLGVVTDLYVEPEARAVGVGEAMLVDLVAFCTNRGCLGMDALALPGHRDTKNFFEEHGFTTRALVVHHELPR